MTGSVKLGGGVRLEGIFQNAQKVAQPTPLLEEGNFPPAFWPPLQLNAPSSQHPRLKSQKLATRLTASDLQKFSQAIGQGVNASVRPQHVDDLTRLTGWVPTRTELNHLFAQLANDPTIPWGYLPEPCEARAETVCYRLNELGIASAKVFALDGRTNEKERYTGLTAGNEQGWVRWAYHVAAVVFARDETTGQVEPFVLDAAVDSGGPMKPGDWLQAISQGHGDVPAPPSVKYDLTFPWQYEPVEYGTRDQTFQPGRAAREMARVMPDFQASQTQGYDPRWGPDRALVEPMGAPLPG